MQFLKERILRDGRSLAGGVLKVDAFLNHQMDAQLMQAIGQEFAQRFAALAPQKIITIEASGIAPALMTGLALGKPVVFAKKRVPSTMEDALTARAFSFTKQQEFTLSLSREFLRQGERVLFIDDFLAQGNAAKAALELAAQAGAEVVGLGFVIEKAFQGGGSQLRAEGWRVESLAIVERLEEGHIILR